MEMKQRQKHISLRYSNQGLTMIELLVAMVVSLLAMTAIYSTFRTQHRSYQAQEETSQMQQNIRTAMYFMQREIRMAGCNPFKTLPLSDFGIKAAGQSTITFTEDITGPAAGTPAVPRQDGFLNDPNENITYSFDGTNLLRTDNNVSPVAQVVAQNIDWLDFVYLDGSNPPNVVPFDVTGFVPVANLGQIRSVEITVVARTDDPLLYGTTNNLKYWNQRQGVAGAASFGPVGDNMSRRRLAAQIYCRNLDF